MENHHLQITPTGPKGKLLSGHLEEFQKGPLRFLMKMANNTVI